jgi:hypothetical protein
MSDRKPNWSKWKLIPNAKIWEVAALSLDIDPNLVRHNPQGWMAGGSYTTLEGQDFKDRVEVIAANAMNDKNSLLYLVTLNQNGKEYCQINIANFAKWAISKSLSLPSELAGLASKEDEAIKPVAEKPLIDRERNSLYRIIAALSATLLNENSSDTSKPHLKNQAALIDHLDQTYDGYEGISKANLEKVLAAANKLIKH